MSPALQARSGGALRAPAPAARRARLERGSERDGQVALGLLQRGQQRASQPPAGRLAARHAQRQRQAQLRAHAGRLALHLLRGRAGGIGRARGTRRRSGRDGASARRPSEACEPPRPPLPRRSAPRSRRGGAALPRELAGRMCLSSRGGLLWAAQGGGGRAGAMPRSSLAASSSVGSTSPDADATRASSAAAARSDPSTPGAAAAPRARQPRALRPERRPRGPRGLGPGPQPPGMCRPANAPPERQARMAGCPAPGGGPARAPLSKTKTARSYGASASAGDAAASRRLDPAPSSSRMTSVASEPGASARVGGR